MDPTTPTPRARRRRRRALPWLLTAAGAALLAVAWWHLFGSSHQAEAQADRLIEEFRATAHAPGHSATGHPQWRTDIEAMPTPNAPTDDDGRQAGGNGTRVGAPAPGATIGVLHVPTWDGLTRGRMPILEGTTNRVLNQGAAGHYTPTAYPGEVGNFAIAAHRRTKGNSFRYLPDLRPGDDMIIETRTLWLRYEVTGQQTVGKLDGTPLLPVPGDRDATPTRRLLTASTCTNPSLGPLEEFGNTHRVMVHAELTGWIARQDGIPVEVATMDGVR